MYICFSCFNCSHHIPKCLSGITFKYQSFQNASTIFTFIQPYKSSHLRPSNNNLLGPLCVWCMWLRYSLIEVRVTLLEGKKTSLECTFCLCPNYAFTDEVRGLHMQWLNIQKLHWLTNNRSLSAHAHIFMPCTDFIFHNSCYAQFDPTTDLLRPIKPSSRQTWMKAYFEQIFYAPTHKSHILKWNDEHLSPLSCQELSNAHSDSAHLLH